MSFNPRSRQQFAVPASFLTMVRQNRVLYANYLTKQQTTEEGCTATIGLENGGVAAADIIPKLLEGARYTSSEERDRILASTACPVAAAPAPAPAPPPPPPPPPATASAIQWNSMNGSSTSFQYSAYTSAIATYTLADIPLDTTYYVGELRPRAGGFVWYFQRTDSVSVVIIVVDTNGAVLEEKTITINNGYTLTESYTKNNKYIFLYTDGNTNYLYYYVYDFDTKTSGEGLLDDSGTAAVPTFIENYADTENLTLFHFATGDYDLHIYAFIGSNLVPQFQFLCGSQLVHTFNIYQRTNFLLVPNLANNALDTIYCYAPDGSSKSIDLTSLNIAWGGSGDPWYYAYDQAAPYLVVQDVNVSKLYYFDFSQTGTSILTDTIDLALLFVGYTVYGYSIEGIKPNGWFPFYAGTNNFYAPPNNYATLVLLMLDVDENAYFFVYDLINQTIVQEPLAFSLYPGEGGVQYNAGENIFWLIGRNLDDEQELILSTLSGIIVKKTITYSDGIEPILAADYYYDGVVLFSTQGVVLLKFNNGADNYLFFFLFPDGSTQTYSATDLNIAAIDSITTSCINTDGMFFMLDNSNNFYAYFVGIPGFVANIAFFSSMCTSYPKGHVIYYLSPTQNSVYVFNLDPYLEGFVNLDITVNTSDFINQNYNPHCCVCTFYDGTDLKIRLVFPDGTLQGYEDLGVGTVFPTNYFNFTDTSLTFSFTDAANNYFLYIFDIPSTTWTKTTFTVPQGPFGYILLTNNYNFLTYYYS